MAAASQLMQQTALIVMMRDSDVQVDEDDEYIYAQRRAIA